MKLTLISNPKFIESYEIQFTQEELDNEDWKCLSELDQKYKQYLSSSSKDLQLYKLNVYYVSNLGRVCKYIKRDKNYVLKSAYTDKDGYKKVLIGRIEYRIHRLVGYLFCNNDDPQNKIVINHKDEITFNNRYTNLEWCTAEYNHSYGNSYKKLSISLKSSLAAKEYHKKMKRKIRRINKLTNEIKEYDSVTEAAIDLGLNVSSSSQIYKFCKNIKIHPIYKFEYIDENQSNITIKRISFKPIIQLNNDMSFINYYLTSEDLKNENFKITNVLKLCNSRDIKHKHSGYFWMFLDDYNQYCISNHKNILIIKCDIVLLTLPHKKFIKQYTSINDIMNDRFRVDKVIKSCKKQIKNVTKFRTCAYLSDFLKDKKITSLSQLKKTDSYYESMCRKK